MSQKKKQKNWLNKHLSDPYVQQSVKDGYRSRAAYKLLEILDKHPILRSGHSVVELGAAPGSWTQVLVKRLGHQGHILAIDLLPMEPMPGMTFIQGNFEDQATVDAMVLALEGNAVDVVLSDMAPNLSGVKSADQARSIGLCELALDFAMQHLAPGGSLLLKCFQGAGIDELAAQMGQCFASVSRIKPKASRDRSREIYLLGRNYQNPR